MGTKYYAVKKGKTPGIYMTWEECKDNVSGVSGAVYKSFSTLEEAEAFLGIKKEKEEAPTSKEKLTAYVDGSYNKETGIYGSGVVLFTSDLYDEVSITGRIPEFADMWNVGGEIEAAMYAVSFAKKNGYPSVDIYYDYLGIEKWATGEWKANKTATQKYRDFMRGSDVKQTFHKVAAHTGVKFNEIADKLAKRACGVEIKED